MSFIGTGSHYSLQLPPAVVSGEVQRLEASIQCSEPTPSRPKVCTVKASQRDPVLGIFELVINLNYSPGHNAVEKADYTITYPAAPDRTEKGKLNIDRQDSEALVLSKVGSASRQLWTLTRAPIEQE